MAGHYRWLRACQLFQDQKVKCKDCGDFGHTARSLRCPMKRWQGALVPLPLGSRFSKENLAWKLQDTPTPGTPKTTERKEEERQRKEEQQRKLLQRFPRRPRHRQPQSWKEEPEPGLCLRHPNMPVLIHTSKRKSFQDPDHPRGSPTRRDDVKSSPPTVPLIGRNLAPASKGRIKAPAARGPRVATRVSRETPAQGQRFDLQPLADRSPSRSVGAVSAAQPLPIICVPAQPLRMLFLRDGEGCWSCGYTAPPSPRPVEQPALPAQSPSVNQEPDGHAVPGPRSILYDDLQVSSSSEESDWDEDTSGN